MQPAACNRTWIFRGLIYAIHLKTISSDCSELRALARSSFVPQRIANAGFGICSDLLEAINICSHLRLRIRLILVEVKAESTITRYKLLSSVDYPICGSVSQKVRATKR